MHVERLGSFKGNGQDETNDEDILERSLGRYSMLLEGTFDVLLKRLRIVKC